MMSAPRENAGRAPARTDSALRLFGVAAIEQGDVASLARDTTIIPFREIAAVVAPTAFERRQPTDEEMAEYFRIVSEVHQGGPILPAPPGTVVRSRDILLRWLELHSVTLAESIQRIEGSEAARVKIRAENDAGQENKQSVALATEVMRTLRGHASATVTIHDTDPPADLLAHASFLVDRERWGTFVDTVHAERERHPKLDIVLSGPWPPFDFVRMQFGA
jgi:hypothetical protein